MPETTAIKKNVPFLQYGHAIKLPIDNSVAPQIPMD